MEDVFKKKSTNRGSRFTHESKLYLPLRKHDYGQNCLSYRGATIWNGLKAKIRNSKSCNSFKHLVKSCFFENLKNKEDNARITFYYTLILLYTHVALKFRVRAKCTCALYLCF